MTSHRTKVPFDIDTPIGYGNGSPVAAQKGYLLAVLKGLVRALKREARTEVSRPGHGGPSVSSQQWDSRPQSRLAQNKHLQASSQSVPGNQRIQRKVVGLATRRYVRDTRV